MEKGKEFADSLLHSAFEGEGLSSSDKGLVTEVVYGVLRHRGSLDWVIERTGKTSLRRLPPPVKNALRMGAYQLLYLDRIPSYAAVHESVELVKGREKRGPAGFVNAVLRAIDRDKGALTYPDPQADRLTAVSVRHSHPQWLVEKWIDRFGEEMTVRLCQANNEIPPVTIRTNTLLTTREALTASLAEEGVASTPTHLSPQGLILSGDFPPLTELSAYQKGWFYVQDEGAQLISLLVSPRSGEKVLDACAAPGGKATHLAELMENRGEIVALDIERKRLDLLIENAHRLKAEIITPLQGDASQTGESVRGKSFDKVLVDAPCSGLGILRRHPEGKWHKKEGLVADYKDLQLRILSHLEPCVKPGGVLIYSTCSTEAEENNDVVSEFLGKHPEFLVDDARPYLPKEAHSLVDKDGCLWTAGNPWRMDTFFAVRLMKEKGG